ncbi:MAG: hypothetical protein ACP5VN_00450 [Acidobacteriota bacterium]
MNAPHLHLVLNHFPVVGSPLVLALGLWAFWKRDPSLVRAFLVGQIVLGFLALAAFFSGSAAEEGVEELPGVSKGLIEAHEEAAYAALALLVLGAATALAALWRARKRGEAAPGALALSLLLLAASSGAAAWTANRGGKIRHPEISASPAPSAAPPSKEGGRGGEREREERGREDR